MLASSWSFAGYVATYAASLIAAAASATCMDTGRLLIVGLVSFALCSLLGRRPRPAVLVLARCLQGAAAALMYPQSLALIRVHFPGRT